MLATMTRPRKNAQVGHESRSIFMPKSYIYSYITADSIVLPSTPHQCSADARIEV